MTLLMQDLEQALRDAAEVEHMREEVREADAEQLRADERAEKYAHENTRLAAALGRAADEQRRLRKEALTSRQACLVAEGTAAELREQLEKTREVIDAIKDDALLIAQRAEDYYARLQSANADADVLAVERNDALERAEDAEYEAETTRLELDVVKGKLAEALTARSVISVVDLLTNQVVGRVHHAG